MKQCNMCGQQNDDYASNCIKCGAPFQQYQEQHNLTQQNGYQQPIQNSYNNYNYQQPIKKNTGKKVLIIILVIIIFILLCCCGFFGIVKLGAKMGIPGFHYSNSITGEKYGDDKEIESEPIKDVELEPLDFNDMVFDEHNILIKIAKDSIKITEKEDTFYIEYDIEVENNSNYDITLQYDDICINNDEDIFADIMMSFNVNAHSKDTIEQEIQVHKKNFTNNIISFKDEQLTDYLNSIRIDFVLLDHHNYYHAMYIDDMFMDIVEAKLNDMASTCFVDYEDSNLDWIEMLDGTYTEATDGNNSINDDTQLIGIEGYFETEVSSDWKLDEHTSDDDMECVYYISSDENSLISVMKCNYDVDFGMFCDYVIEELIKEDDAHEIAYQKNESTYSSTLNFIYKYDDGMFCGGLIRKVDEKTFLFSLETAPGLNISESEYIDFYNELLDKSIQFGF